MKFVIIITLLLIALPVLSQVKVQNDMQGNFEITGKSCEILQKNFEAIKIWKQKKGETVHATGTCHCSELECKMDITKIVPDEIKIREGTAPLTYGPNCFNTALVDQGILKSRRIVSTDEIKFWVKSKLCRERDEDEALEAGDLVIISHGEALPLHGFTYLSDDLVFSKGGPAQEVKYELTSYDSMFANYDIPKECRRKFGDPGKEICRKYANAYKCESFENLNFKSKNEELNNILTGLENIGCAINKKLFPETVGFTAGKELLISTIEVFRVQILDNRNDPNSSAEDKFLWDMAYHRFFSLRKQLDYF